MDLRKYIKWSLKAVAPQKMRPEPGPRQLPFLEIDKTPSKFPKLKEWNKLAPVDFAAAMSIKVGDLVRVLYGKDAGNDGIIQSIDRVNNQVIVSRCNMEKVSWNPEVFKDKPKSGPHLISSEAPIHITNICPIDPVLKMPTRIKTRRMMSGELVRISKLSRCAMPDPVHVPTKPAEPPVTHKHNRTPPPLHIVTPEKLAMLQAVADRLANRSV